MLHMVWSKNVILGIQLGEIQEHNEGGYVHPH